MYFSVIDVRRLKQLLYDAYLYIIYDSIQSTVQVIFVSLL